MIFVWISEQIRLKDECVLVSGIPLNLSEVACTVEASAATFLFGWESLALINSVNQV
ncbi:hypothetical protein [Paenibacillus borealis]|uniref:hypothetical protein n=1 Tax=Paenibacillus borealis TaxID=160799 RepID=UPI000A61D56A|nr:hypothetical protein [Paenibacillus borealis]